jgi:hypothetical protein
MKSTGCGTSGKQGRELVVADVAFEGVATSIGAISDMGHINAYYNAAEAEADRAQQKPLRSTRVDLEPIGLTEQGQRYRVTYAGETLVEGCRNPIFDACRALLARGITGRLEIWRRGKKSADMQLDIEKGAGKVICETAAQSLRVESVSRRGPPLATASVGDTYDSAAEAEADRVQQKQLLTALNASDRALRRDECGAWTLIGRQGSIHTWGDGTSWVLFVACRSRQQWTSTKKRLAFCTVTQDGEDEGCLRLQQLPTPEQAKVIRDVLGLWKRREVSTEERERLSALLSGSSRTGRSGNGPNIALGDRPVPDGRPGSEGNILPVAAPVAEAPVQRPKRPPWW